MQNSFPPVDLQTIHRRQEPYKGPAVTIGYSERTRSMQIDIFSDTVCPWCYLGKRRLELAVAARPHYDIRLKWRPFELNSELPLEGVPRAAGTAESQGELERQGAACGINFR